MVRSNLVSISVGYPNLFNVKLTNTQNADTPSPFQQMLQLPVSQLQSYTPILASDFHNIRFVYNGTAIPAWLESISNGVATIWVKIPVSIPANSSITIDMEVDPSLNFDGVYWGEAPQLSSTYGQYDNGSSVFNDYWNFVGTSLPNDWTGTGYTINNGISIPYSSYAYTTSNFGYNTNTIVDFYGNFPTATSVENAAFGFVKQGTGNAGVDVAWSINQNNPEGTSNAIGQVANNSGFTFGNINATGYHVYSIYFAPSFVIFSYDYSIISSQITTSLPSSPYPLGGINTQGLQSTPGPFYWVRVRAYPPNGVMPSVEVIA